MCIFVSGMNLLKCACVTHVFQCTDHVWTWPEPEPAQTCFVLIGDSIHPFKVNEAD